MQVFEVRLTETALEMLEEIADRRVRKTLWNKLQGLREEPEKQGKPLANELRGCRSLRALGQRYRIVFQVIRDQRQVIVLGVGLRKQGDRRDIYALLQRLLG